MKITYDPQVDAMYIRLVDGKHECEVQHINEDVTLDIGADGLVVGIEILDVSRTLGEGKLPTLTLENISNLVSHSADSHEPVVSGK